MVDSEFLLDLMLVISPKMNRDLEAFLAFLKFVTSPGISQTSCDFC